MPISTAEPASRSEHGSLIEAERAGWRLRYVPEHRELAVLLAETVPPRPARVLRDDYRSFVGVLELEGARVVAKSPRLKNRSGWIRWTTLFRSGEAFGAIEGAWNVHQAGVRVPAPILAIERRERGRVVDSWFFYEYVEGRPCARAEYPQLVAALRRLHDAGWIHGDPHFENFLWDGRHVRLLDCRPRRSRWGAMARAYDRVLLRNSRPELAPLLDLDGSLPVRLAVAYDRWIHHWRGWKKRVRNWIGRPRDTAAQTARIRKESGASGPPLPGDGERPLGHTPPSSGSARPDVAEASRPVGALQGPRLRIALVVRHYHRRGGISRYVAALAEVLVRHHEVHVFAATFRDVADSRIVLHRIPIVSIPALTRRKRHAWNGFFEVTSFTWAATLTIDPGEFDLFLPQGDYFGRYDAYTVHSCHRAWLELARGGLRGIAWLKKSPVNPLHAFVLAVERHAVRSARHIVATSEVTRREIIEQYRVEPARVTIVPIGVDLDRFAPEQEPRADRVRIRQRHGIGAGEVVGLFPAHEFARKGLREIVQAMAAGQGNDVRLLVVGRDDPAPFLALAKSLGVGERLTFAGETDEIEAYYRAADFLVFPTRYEPFGMIITEALAAGLPVVVSRCAGAAELVTDGIEGILLNDPQDVREIAAALARLAEDPALRARMGASARRTAERYGWEPIIERLWAELQR
ncbi:MAG: glycosyltransferase [Candidatus Eisenbacteria bacterium]